MNLAPSTIERLHAADKSPSPRVQREMGKTASVLLIRHGESTSNLAGTIAGHENVELTELGRQQALEAGEKIKESGQKIDHIITSNLIRASDTADIIAGVIGLSKDKIDHTDLVSERYLGKLQGQPANTLKFARTAEQYKAAGAESETALMQRAQELLESLSKYKGTTLIVAHNQFLKAVRACELGIPFSEVPGIPNAEIFPLNEKELLLTNDSTTARVPAMA